ASAHAGGAGGRLVCVRAAPAHEARAAAAHPGQPTVPAHHGEGHRGRHGAASRDGASRRVGAGPASARRSAAARHRSGDRDGLYRLRDRVGAPRRRGDRARRVPPRRDAGARERRRARALGAREGRGLRAVRGPGGAARQRHRVQPALPADEPHRGPGPGGPSIRSARRPGRRPGRAEGDPSHRGRGAAASGTRRRARAGDLRRRAGARGGGPHGEGRLRRGRDAARSGGRRALRRGENAMKNGLTLALPKGRLLDPALDLLRELGVSGIDPDSRKLIFRDAGRDLEILLLKPADVPAYVIYGAADLGVVGKDILLEQEPDVYEPLDLGFGFCRLVVAEPRALWERDDPAKWSWVRVATKYPRLTEEYFSARGIQVEIVRLDGSIELAPLVGLAERIVDLVQSGETLRANGLVEVAEITRSTARV